MEHERPAEEEGPPRRGKKSPGKKLNNGNEPYRGGATGRRIDWQLARSMYVHGDSSLKEVAESLGVHPGTLQTRAAKEGWTEARGEWRDELADHLEERALKTAEERHKEMLDRVYFIRMEYCQKLHKALSEGKVDLSIEGLNKLARLERDLDMPGWTKSAEEKKAGHLDLGDMFRAALDANRQARQDALVEGATAPVKAAPSDESVAFKGDEGDWTEDEDREDQAEAGG